MNERLGRIEPCQIVVFDDLSQQDDEWQNLFPRQPKIGFNGTCLAPSRQCCIVIGKDHLLMSLTEVFAGQSHKFINGMVPNIGGLWPRI